MCCMDKQNRLCDTTAPDVTAVTTQVLSLAASEESDARPAEPDAAALVQRMQLDDAAIIQSPAQ